MQVIVAYYLMTNCAYVKDQKGYISYVHIFLSLGLILAQLLLLVV